LSNSKRGIAVDENGKLDDEVSIISSEVCLKLILWLEEALIRDFLFVAAKKTLSKQIFRCKETCQ
jgi:hypothetical protein